MADFREVTHISDESLIEGLTACICCDEPDGDKYRAETRYWLTALLERLRKECTVEVKEKLI